MYRCSQLRQWCSRASDFVATPTRPDGLNGRTSPPMGDSGNKVLGGCTRRSGRQPMVPFLRATTSITSTKTRSTTPSRTSRQFIPIGIGISTSRTGFLTGPVSWPMSELVTGTAALKVVPGIASMPKQRGPSVSHSSARVSNVGRSTTRSLVDLRIDSVRPSARPSGVVNQASMTLMSLVPCAGRSSVRMPTTDQRRAPVVVAPVFERYAASPDAVDALRYGLAAEAQPERDERVVELSFG
jgi:hypothetical protein